MSNKIIVLEGLPGTGKSTLADLFTEQGVSTIPEMILKEEGSSTGMGELFYFKNDLEKIRRAKEMGGCVLVERSYPSTLAHNYAKMIVDEAPEYYSILRAFAENKRSSELVPDLYISFSLDVRTSLLRKNRPVSDQDIWTQEKYLDRIKDFYDNYFNFIEPDIPVVTLSGKDSIEVLFDKIKKYISD